MCYEVRWDNGEYEKMSPWDLEPINEQSKYFYLFRGIAFWNYLLFLIIIS